MEHRVFITYSGLSDPDQHRWIDWCNTNMGVFGETWWQQEVTDNWDGNTSCWYFKTEQDAERFNFYVNLSRTQCQQI